MFMSMATATIMGTVIRIECSRMNSAQVSAVLATVGAAFLAQSIACALLFRRVRALSLRHPSTEHLSSPSAEIADRVRALEARLSRLEMGVRRKASTASSEPKRRRLDRRQLASSDGPVLIAVPSLASTPSSTSTEAAAEFDRRFGAICALADSGASTDVIARSTGYPVGQVELILGLRRPKPAEVSGLDPVRGETDV